MSRFITNLRVILRDAMVNLVVQKKDKPRSHQVHKVFTQSKFYFLLNLHVILRDAIVSVVVKNEDKPQSHEVHQVNTQSKLYFLFNLCVILCDTIGSVVVKKSPLKLRGPIFLTIIPRNNHLHFIVMMQVVVQALQD